MATRATRAARSICVAPSRRTQAAAVRRSVCTSAAKGSADGFDRRALLTSLALLVGSSGASEVPAHAESDTKLLDTVTPMSAIADKDYGKTRTIYPDFTSTSSGLQYKDYRDGDGDAAQAGDMVVLDWDGYTIGYYGRPFEARNKPKGSSFSGENKDYIRFKLGDGTMIPAVEEAVVGMKPGGIRRIVVPEELGYPSDDWRRLGPKPSTFAGERALGFVLENRGMVDKTLLIDIELKKIVRG